jgi:hypothetical protein
LLPEGEVLQEEFLSGAKDGDNPSKQMSKVHKHQEIIAKSTPEQVRLQIIDSAEVRSFGEAQGFGASFKVVTAFYLT